MAALQRASSPLTDGSGPSRHSPSSTATRRDASRAARGQGAGPGTRRCQRVRPRTLPPLRAAIAECHASRIDHVALVRAVTSSSCCWRGCSPKTGPSRTVPSVRTRCINFRRRHGGRHDVDDAVTADLVFVCRPNNPTGELPDIPETRVNSSSTRRTPTTPVSTRSIALPMVRSFSVRSPRPTVWRVRAWATPLLRPRLIAVITSRQAPLSARRYRRVWPSPHSTIRSTSVPRSKSVSGSQRNSRCSDSRRRHSFANSSSFQCPIPRDRRPVASLGVVVRAFAEGLRVSVDELDDNVLLDALRAELTGTPVPSDFLRYRRATAETLLNVRLRVTGKGASL